MKDHIPATKVRQVFILILILLMSVVLIDQMLPYLGGVLAALTLYVLLLRFQLRLEKKKWKKSIAAVFLIVLATIVILIPVVGTALMFSTKVSKAVKNSEKITQAVKTQMTKAEEYVGFDIAGSIDSSKVSEWVSSSLSGLASSSVSVFIALGIMYFMLYYLLICRDTWRQALRGYIPLKRKNFKILADESDRLVKSNAIGIPLVALLQGLVALLGFWIFGVNNPFFWFVVTAIGSMIPFVGTALGIIPVTILLFSQGESGNAIGILIWGLTVVGVTDNLFRLVVQKRLADIHPLVTLIGVIIGVPLFGFIGLIFGPLLVSLFLLLVKIYKNEYGKSGTPKGFDKPTSYIKQTSDDST